MIIAYTGTSDFQEFSSADFAKAGIEGAKKVRFARAEPTEVPDEVGEALTSDEGVFGGHSFEDLSDVGTDADSLDQMDEEEREAARLAAEKAAKKTAKKASAPTKSQTGKGAQTQSASDTGGAGSGPTRTGAGSST